jgi:hypothetical protein
MSDSKTKPELNEHRPEDTQAEEETPEQPERPINRWMASFTRGMEAKAPQTLAPKATKDRMKPLILGLLAVAALVVTLLGMFSTPIGKRRQQQVAEHRTPNLGRPLATDPLLPAQDLGRSVTPLMGADLRSPLDTSYGMVTASDLQGSSTRNPLPNLGPVPSPSQSTSMPAPPFAFPLPSGGNAPGSTTGRYALGRIEFSDVSGEKKESLAEVESRIAKLESQVSARRSLAVTQQICESLAKPSLVYVHNPSFGSLAPAPRLASLNTNAQDYGDSLELLAGMRLIARLQSAITTAVVTPVVAMVEYNYEKDGEIVVPAGSKVFGKLEQANRSGHVSIKFDLIEMPNGPPLKIDGSAQGLDYGPLKGRVDGKKNVTRFITRAVTGVGVVASQVVGLRGGFNGPISNSVLIRDRLANSIAQAGDQQMQQIAMSANIVVTVPGNTRFYVVLQKAVGGNPEARMNHQATTVALPSKMNTSANDTSLTHAELDELRNLKEEFKRLMLVSGGQLPSSQNTSDSK